MVLPLGGRVSRCQLYFSKGPVRGLFSFKYIPMGPKPAVYFKIEFIWWLFTALLIAAVLLPIYSAIYFRYPFYWINSIYIICFVTLTRYTFLLQQTFLAKQQALKVIIFFLCLPLGFYLIQELNTFQTFLDEEGWDAVVGNLDYGKRNGMINYMRNQMLLFGVGSIISTVVFPFRLLISFWRTRNRGTV